MNDLMTAERREHPAEAAAVAEVPDNAAMRGAAGGLGRVGRVLSLVRLHFLSLRGPLPFLLGLLLIVGVAGIVSGSIALVSGFLAGTALVGGLSGVMAERWPPCPSPGPMSSTPTGWSRCCISWPPRPFMRP